MNWIRSQRAHSAGFSCLVVSLLVGGLSAAWAGNGSVALQTADPSCGDDSADRYVDCGNGTVTDNQTGLVWLANADCLNFVENWGTAMEFVAGLSDKPATSVAALDDCGLSDGSSPGEWRLPSVEEWEAMIMVADSLGCSPAITNDSGNDCWDEACVTAGACSFTDVEDFFYWSASGYSFFPPLVWSVDLEAGTFALRDKTGAAYLWPVRGGQ